MTSHLLLQVDKYFGLANFWGVISILALAVFFDVKSMRIPNLLILTGIITSFISQTALFGRSGMADWGLGLLLGLSLFFPFYFLRVLGAGDVKLLATVGAFIGPSAIFEVTLFTLASGGILAILYALRIGAFRQSLENVRFMVTHSAVRTLQGKSLTLDELPVTPKSIPYAIAITTGTICYFLIKIYGYALS